MILVDVYNSELGGVVPMLEGPQKVIKFNGIHSVNHVDLTLVVHHPVQAVLWSLFWF